MKVEKYHGCGNDFLILEKVDGINYSTLAISFCDRNVSFGSDGLIVVDIKERFVYFFNADGSESDVCGNGLRCAYLYLLRHGYDYSYLYAKDGRHDFALVNDLISVTFPLNLNIEIKQDEWYLCGKKHKVYHIDVGNPHIVIVSSLKMNEIKCFKEYAKEKNTNINFVEILAKDKIKINTIERGVGLTNSCGSGAIATSICLYLESLIDENVEVINNYGNLKIDLKNGIRLIGPSKFVYRGEIDD